jgi:hypothetical protein
VSPKESLFLEQPVTIAVPPPDLLGLWRKLASQYGANERLQRIIDTVDLFSPSMRRAPSNDEMCYSALMPAALMTGHHFSMPAFWTAASASGVSS